MWFNRLHTNIMFTFDDAPTSSKVANQQNHLKSFNNFILLSIIFKVSIVAASTCRYLYWQRSALEYLFVKETYIATVLTTLIARDITTKLYAMNNKIVTAKGSHLDIRLPSITSSLTSGGEYKSPIRIKKANGKKARDIVEERLDFQMLCCRFLLHSLCVVNFY